MSKVVPVTTVVIPTLGTANGAFSVTLTPVGITREGIGRWTYVYDTPVDSVSRIVASVNVSMKPNGVSTIDQVGRCSLVATVPIFSKTLVSGTGSAPTTDKYAYALIGMVRYQDGQIVVPKGVSGVDIQQYVANGLQGLISRTCTLHQASACGEVLYA